MGWRSSLPASARANSSRSPAPRRPTSAGCRTQVAGPGGRFPRPRERWQRQWCWPPGSAWRVGRWRWQGRGGCRWEVAMGRGRGPAGSDSLQGRGLHSSSAPPPPLPPGARAALRPRGTRSLSAGRGTLPLPKRRLQGSAPRSDWWSRWPLLKPRRGRNEPAMTYAVHRPWPRGRHKVTAPCAALSKPTEGLPPPPPPPRSSSVRPAELEGAILLPVY